MKQHIGFIRGLVFDVTIMAFLSLTVQGATVALWNANTNAETQNWYRTVFKPAFEAEHPNTTLELSFPTNWDTFYDQMLVAVASGVAPDVVTSNNALFYTEGLVIDLNDRITSWPLAKDFYPPVLRMQNYHGHIYGLPMAIAPRTLVVNKRLLAEAGYNASKPPTTWDEIAQATPRLTRWNADHTTLEQIAIAYDLGSTGAVHGFVYTNGGEIMNPDGTAAFNDNKGVEALNFWSQLFRQYLPPGVSRPTFAQGKAAMIPYNNPAIFSSIAKTNGDLLKDIAVAPQPITQKRACVLLFGAPIGITNASRNKDLAWELLAFHYRNDMLGMYNQLQGFIPPTRPALTREVLRNSPWISDYLVLTEALGIPTWAYESPVYQMVNGYLASAADVAYKGAVPAQQALDEAARLWNQVLAEHRK